MRIKRAIVIGTVTLASIVATAGSASAYTYPTSECGPGQVCLYYNSSSSGFGAVFKQSSNISNYSGYYFSSGKNGSSGAGLSVKNNVAAVDNRSDGSYFSIFYNSGYDCSVACMQIGPNNAVDIPEPMKNDNASGRYGEAP